MPESCDLISSILEGLVDIAYLMDTDGNFVYVNSPVREYGYEPAELVGNSVFKMVFEEDREILARAFAKRKQGSSGVEWVSVRLRDKDGRVIPFEMKAKIVYLENALNPIAGSNPRIGNGKLLSGSFLLGTARDVSGRKQVERSLVEVKNQFEEPTQGQTDQAKTGKKRQLAEMLLIPGRDERLSRSMARIWATSDFDGEILKNQFYQMEDKIRLALGCMEVVMLEVFNHKQISPEQYAFVSDLAMNVVKLVEFLDELSGGLPALLDYVIGQPYEVPRHCLNVGIYTTMFCRELTPRTILMNRAQIKRACLGALMHDIGKAYLDRGTLEQNSNLTPRDRDIVRKHPLIGARMLQKVEAGKEELQVVLQHHDMFQDPGAQSRLAGLNITPMAYVVAICNVFDNLTSVRPGRKSRNAYEALTMMVKNMRSDMFTPLLKNFIKVMGSAT